MHSELSQPRGAIPIVIFTTGGTIDKLYFDTLSEHQVGESVVHKLLSLGRVTQPYWAVEVCRKDSLEMTDADMRSRCQLIHARPDHQDELQSKNR